MIFRGQDAGKLSDAEAQTLLDKLSSLDPNKIKEVQKALKEIFLPRDRTEAAGKILKVQEDMRIAALEGLDKEKAEALRAKMERFKDIDEQASKFKTFKELTSALTDQGRAEEIEGLKSVYDYRLRLQRQADGEYQTRVAKAVEAADKEKAARTEAKEREIVQLLQSEKNYREQVAAITERWQKEQDEEDEKELRRMEEAQQDKFQRIQSNPFTDDAQKFNQLRDEGADVSNMADPSSFTDQMRAGFAAMRTEWGTLQQQIAQGFYGTINNGVNAVSEGLTGLIFQTDGWRQRLAQIPAQILRASLVRLWQMGVRWIATQLLMAGCWQSDCSRINGSFSSDCGSGDGHLDDARSAGNHCQLRRGRCCFSWSSRGRRLQ